MKIRSMVRLTKPRGHINFFQSTKFILLINVKMTTSIGILTFISRINTTSDFLFVDIFLLFLNS